MIGFDFDISLLFHVPQFIIPLFLILHFLFQGHHAIRFISQQSNQQMCLTSNLGLILTLHKQVHFICHWISLVIKRKTHYEPKDEEPDSFHNLKTSILF